MPDWHSCDTVSSKCINMKMQDWYWQNWDLGFLKYKMLKCRNDIDTVGVRAGCALTAFEDSSFNGDQVLILFFYNLYFVKLHFISREPTNVFLHWHTWQLSIAAWQKLTLVWSNAYITVKPGVMNIRIALPSIFDFRSPSGQTVGIGEKSVWFDIHCIVHAVVYLSL